jgi:hypothetical protein
MLGDPIGKSLLFSPKFTTFPRISTSSLGEKAFFSHIADFD